MISFKKLKTKLGRSLKTAAQFSIRLNIRPYMFSRLGRMRFTHLPRYPGLIRAPRSFNGGFVFLGGPTFLHANTLAQPAGLTQSRQSEHARALLPRTKGLLSFFLK